MDEMDRTVGIAEAAAATGLAPDTLRYFEREGIVPAPQRDAHGRRRYTAADLDTITMLAHLRDAGMPLADIAAFTGHDSNESRLGLLRAHEARIHDRRRALDRALDAITRKIETYSRDSGNPDGQERHTLQRPDTTITYTVQGTGPLLFLVGAPAGRAGFAPLAEQLAAAFTVVTYDPRGIDDSPRTPGMADPTPDALAGDLGALVDEFTDAPSRFVGTSGGAVTLLALATTRPDLIRKAVLHEPPLITLLDDPELEARAAAAFSTAHQDPQHALQEFFDISGAIHHTGPGQYPPAHTPLPALPEPELDKNRYFLGHMAGPTVFYRPDVRALRTAALILCAGELSHNQMARCATERLAHGLGLDVVDTPGNHLGPSTEARRFGESVKPRLLA